MRLKETSLLSIYCASLQMTITSAWNTDNSTNNLITDQIVLNFIYFVLKLYVMLYFWQITEN